MHLLDINTQYYYKSSIEGELTDFIKSIYGGVVIINTRTVIGPKELDIYLPELNIAFEYCGLYWHSELYGMPRAYHLNKLNACTYKGIRLIQIFENEWLSKKSIVLSRIKNVITKNNQTISMT